ncbi:hypothetical protein HYH02_001484 [Chlamydomonas schloesseri]|uniref:mitogen-activated protein kinase kinase kinase n=1 Tax=Chlamydomonas schloesseri TaxID=2026947 RepID=A0A835WVF8_9CHLO|nr:hypothetical protein HYH02_001484 [Chlamydomonas schloesseri]|eukprot:KAG2454465.1 hypothetical protein HYH02_001484 [Chlamydomonas schloesseri]
MSTRKPPIAPKAQGAGGPVEALHGQALDNYAPSPHKHSFSDHGGQLGPTRPRSPRPAEVYHAAMAELTEGDGRGLTKIKISGASPANSPGRRRATTTLASGNTLHPLSPRTVSILDHPGSSAAGLSVTGSGLSSSLRPATTSGGGAAVLLSGTASSRTLGGAFEEAAAAAGQRVVSAMDATGLGSGGVSTPPRKVTSAPDSQSMQAQLRGSNPWRPSGGGAADLLAGLMPTPPSQPPPAASPPRASLMSVNGGLASASAVAAAASAVALGSSPGRGGGLPPAAPSPPQAQQQLVPIPPMPFGASPLGSGLHVNASPPPHGLPPAGPGQAAMLAAGGGSGRERRNSASSTDSPGVYDSPMGGPTPPNLASLRVATMGRTGSPLSPQPSTPGSTGGPGGGGGGGGAGSLPHTPTTGCSSLKPRPPGEAPLVSRASRKFSHLANSPAAGAAAGGAAGTPLSGPASGRHLHLHTGSGIPEEFVMAQRSNSIGGTGDRGLTSTHSFAANLLYNNFMAGNGSQPGTPVSNSRPGSGRNSSARSRPVAVLVDAVRTKDDDKLREAIEALRGPQGNILGLNDRHHVTCRTPLHEAAMSNCTSMVALLLAAGADPNIPHPTQGPPLLHCAAFGEVDTMQLLLLEGADVNAGDVEQQTALHFACVGGHVDAARMLIKFGADVRARNEDGQAPFDLAQPEMLRLVLASDVAPSPERRPGSAASTSTSRPSSRSAAPTAERGLEGTPPSASSGMGGGGGGSRRSLGGRPPLGSTGSAAGGGGGGMPSSPGTVPLYPASLTAAAAAVHGAAVGGTGAGSGGGSLNNSLRPAPPTVDMVGAAAVASAGGGGSGPRSRRNSGSFTAAVMNAAALPSGPPPPSQPLMHSPPPPGQSPVRHPGELAPAGSSALTSAAATPVGAGGAAGGASAAGGGGGGGAPASPLMSDGEAVPPASPPTLTLPGGVRRQLSRGAGLGDILHAFQQDDAEMVKRSQPPDAAAHVSAAGQSAGPHGHPPLPPSSSHHPPGIPAGPSAAAAKFKDTPPRPPSGGGAPAAAAAPAAAVGFMPSAAAFAAFAGKATPGGGGGAKGKDEKKEEPQQPLLPFSMPETSMIRFGIPLQVHAAGEAGNAGGSDGGAGVGGVDAEGRRRSSGDGSTTSRQPSVAQPLPSFSAQSRVTAAPSIASFGFSAASSAAGGGGGGSGGDGGFQAPTITVPSVAGGSVGFSAVGFMPVPATGFTPRISNSGAGGPAGPGGRVSTSGDDFGGPTPPLVRDSSPVRERGGGVAAAGSNAAAAGGGAAAAGGAAGGGGGGAAAGSHGSSAGGGVGVSGSSGGRFMPTRTSQLAAQALKRMSHTDVSTDAIEMRAAAMFRQSTEMTAGELAWTRGELLGEGAYGKVYAGLNQQTGELMAVKVLQLLSKHGNKEAVFAQLEALEHEMSLYKKLKHKHVVGYIDARFDSKTSAFYIFLEYVPGGSIASMLNRFGRFSEDLVRNYTRQLLMGLEYLHGCKIVHRDLKGGNALVSRDGIVKLADFGASKAYRDHTITDCMKSVRGSVFWMAPEVIRGTGYGRRADIWSLGCTVIEMLTGAHPWPHLDNQWTAMFTIAKTEEGPPRPKGISEEARRFLDKCLQFDPAKRPTAAELLQDPFVARAGAGAAAAGTNTEDRLQHSF